MSEDNLSELLERTADRHEVSAPPLDQILTHSRRVRKRRAGNLGLAASVIVGTAIISTTWLLNQSDSEPATTNLSDQQIVPWKAITPGPSPSPDLAVPLRGSSINVSLILRGYERQSAPDAARYEFVVRLSNAGNAPVSLDPCPFYRVAFVKDVETGYLNCDQAPSEIPAAGHVDFAMQAPAHDAELLAREGGNGFVLTWELGTEGAEGAAATEIALLSGSAVSSREPICVLTDPVVCR